MIINMAPPNQAVLSNVGSVSSFAIKATAKSFRILSDGLYANKVRAIIRELSCNAYDSHVAAGKIDTPFDVHLPNSLEPWFSIRDYGTGLNHDQVTNIFTTFFESTKTDSNEYVGALGLGSKSPFSYTNNFTVTAIQSGRKGIYTAFINEHGIPCIALMHEEKCDEPNGVEVKFSVNDRTDYNKFLIEAQSVYTYFKLRPIVHGANNFKINDPVYKNKDIIEGVHYAGPSNSSSIALMGNIAYPIDISQADSTLGSLRELLGCNLVMGFNIGELDFQASREGLSYIPSTVQAIKNKLEALYNQLAIHIATEAEKFTNLWDRADYLKTHYNEKLWRQAVVKYVQDTKFVLAQEQAYLRYEFLKTLTLEIEELRTKYNINIRGFTKTRKHDKCANIKAETFYDNARKLHVSCIKIFPSREVSFVVSNTKRGALDRAKYHWRANDTNQQELVNNVYIIEAADKSRSMDLTQFLSDLYKPPRVLYANQLLEKSKPKGNRTKKTNILKLEHRNRGGRFSKPVLCWIEAGTIDDFPCTDTYYYVQLQNRKSIGLPVDEITLYHNLITGAGIFHGPIYGVRKSDYLNIRTQKNWVELTEHVRGKLNVLANTFDVLSLVKDAIDFKSFFKYASDKLNQNSPYYKMYLQFKDVKVHDTNMKHNLERLLQAYGLTISKIDPSDLISKYKAEVQQLKKRYPLLSSLTFSVQYGDVVDYINLIDRADMEVNTAATSKK